MYRHVGLRSWRLSRGRTFRSARCENRKTRHSTKGAARVGPVRRVASNAEGRPGRDERRRETRVGATLGEQYDVYVAEPIPLQEGESKHTISVFVGDESGLINRVAGVFGRRGSNIESLAVGLNNERALFTIVANGSDATINNLVKQLSKLVKVRYVEDITNSKRVDREMVMLKVSASAGEQRTEVMQFCDIFRAKIVDVADEKITVSVAGDPGKIAAFESSLSKFGICELVRTGLISLKRGEQLLEPGQNGDKRTGKKKPHKTTKYFFSIHKYIHQWHWMNRKPEKESEESAGADVYVVEEDVGGVWEVEDVLENTDEGESEYEPYTLQIEVDNSPGVLNQVTGMFARRGYNVQSLAVGPSEAEGRSRICMVVPGDDSSIEKLIKQLYRLVNVQHITNMTKLPFVAQELMLIKVQCLPEKRTELETLASIFRGSLCDVSFTTMTVQMQGKPKKLRAFLDIVEPYGILEVARTGCIALKRESRVSSETLKYVQRSKIF